MIDWNALAASGPAWGVVASVITLVGTLAVNRANNRKDKSTATLEAIHKASEQLVGSLFNQVKTLQADIEVLRKHNEECNRKHAEAMELILSLQTKVASYEARLTDAAT